MWTYNNSYELYHHGILGQKWGVRRYQNEDGSLTPAGEKRYKNDGKLSWSQALSLKRGTKLTDNQAKNVEREGKKIEQLFKKESIASAVGLGFGAVGALSAMAIVSDTFDKDSKIGKAAIGAAIGGIGAAAASTIVMTHFEGKRQAAERRAGITKLEKHALDVANKKYKLVSED